MKKSEENKNENKINQKYAKFKIIDSFSDVSNDDIETQMNNLIKEEKKKTLEKKDDSNKNNKNIKFIEIEKNKKKNKNSGKKKKENKNIKNGIKKIIEIFNSNKQRKFFCNLKIVFDNFNKINKGIKKSEKIYEKIIKNLKRKNFKLFKKFYNEKKDEIERKKQIEIEKIKKKKEEEEKLKQKNKKIENDKKKENDKNKNNKIIINEKEKKIENKINLNNNNNNNNNDNNNKNDNKNDNNNNNNKKDNKKDIKNNNNLNNKKDNKNDNKNDKKNDYIKNDNNKNDDNKNDNNTIKKTNLTQRKPSKKNKTVKLSFSTENNEYLVKNVITDNTNNITNTNNKQKSSFYKKYYKSKSIQNIFKKRPTIEEKKNEKNSSFTEDDPIENILKIEEKRKKLEKIKLKEQNYLEQLNKRREIGQKELQNIDDLINKQLSKRSKINKGENVSLTDSIDSNEIENNIIIESEKNSSNNFNIENIIKKNSSNENLKLYKKQYSHHFLNNKTKNDFFHIKTEVSSKNLRNLSKRKQTQKSLTTNIYKDYGIIDAIDSSNERFRRKKLTRKSTTIKQIKKGTNEFEFHPIKDIKTVNNSLNSDNEGDIDVSDSLIESVEEDPKNIKVDKSELMEYDKFYKEQFFKTDVFKFDLLNIKDKEEEEIRKEENRLTIKKKLKEKIKLKQVLQSKMFETTEIEKEINELQKEYEKTKKIDNEGVNLIMNNTEQLLYNGRLLSNYFDDNKRINAFPKFSLESPKNIGAKEIIDFKTLNKEEQARRFYDRCCCLKQRKTFNKWLVTARFYCLIFVNNQYFDNFSLFIILLNTILILISDPRDSNSIANVTDQYFLYFYTLEAILKIITFGFITTEFAYMKDSWNILDFFVVFVGWISFILERTMSGKKISGLSGLRAFRILRPLKTVKSVKGLKQLVIALLASISHLGETSIILFFFFLIFSIAGTQMWQGNFMRRCMDEAYGNIVSFKESEGMCTFDSDCVEYNENGHRFICVKGFYNPNNDLISFDNTLYGLITVFQMATLEGWTLVFTYVSKTFKDKFYINPVIIFAYFHVFVFIGGFYLINLFLAVTNSEFEKIEVTRKELTEKKSMFLLIKNKYDLKEKEKQEKKKKNRELKKKNINKSGESLVEMYYRVEEDAFHIKKNQRDIPVVYNTVKDMHIINNNNPEEIYRIEEMIDEEENLLCKDIKKQQREIQALIDEKRKEDKKKSELKSDANNSKFIRRMSRKNSKIDKNQLQKFAMDFKNNSNNNNDNIIKKKDKIYQTAIELSITQTENFLKNEMLNMNKNNEKSTKILSNNILKQKIEKKEMEKYLAMQVINKPDLDYEKEIKKEKEKHLNQILEKTESENKNKKNKKKPKKLKSLKDSQIYANNVLRQIYNMKKNRQKIEEELSFLTDLSITNMDESIEDSPKSPIIFSKTKSLLSSFTLEDIDNINENSLISSEGSTIQNKNFELDKSMKLTSNVEFKSPRGILPNLIKIQNDQEIKKKLIKMRQNFSLENYLKKEQSRGFNLNEGLRRKSFLNFLQFEEDRRNWRHLVRNIDSLNHEERSEEKDLSLFNDENITCSSISFEDISLLPNFIEYDDKNNLDILNLNEMSKKQELNKFINIARRSIFDKNSNNVNDNLTTHDIKKFYRNMNKNLNENVIIDYQKPRGRNPDDENRSHIFLNIREDDENNNNNIFYTITNTNNVNSNSYRNDEKLKNRNKNKCRILKNNQTKIEDNNNNNNNNKDASENTQIINLKLKTSNKNVKFNLENNLNSTFNLLSNNITNINSINNNNNNINLIKDENNNNSLEKNILEGDLLEDAMNLNYENEVNLDEEEYYNYKSVSPNKNKEKLPVKNSNDLIVEDSNKKYTDPLTIQQDSIPHNLRGKKYYMNYLNNIIDKDLKVKDTFKVDHWENEVLSKKKNYIKLKKLPETTEAVFVFNDKKLNLKKYKYVYHKDFEFADYECAYLTHALKNLPIQILEIMPLRMRDFGRFAVKKEINLGTLSSKGDSNKVNAKSMNIGKNNLSDSAHHKSNLIVSSSFSNYNKLQEQLRYKKGFYEKVYKRIDDFNYRTLALYFEKDEDLYFKLTDEKRREESEKDEYEKNKLSKSNFEVKSEIKNIKIYDLKTNSHRYILWSGSDIMHDKDFDKEREKWNNMISSLEDFSVIIWNENPGVQRGQKIKFAFYIVAINPWFDYFIILVVCINAIFMALDGNLFTYEQIQNLNISNYVFNGIFIAEFILKFIGLGPIIYFSDAFTYLDVIIIVFAIVDMASPSTNTDEIGKKQSLSSSLSFLRVFRIFRVLRLTKVLRRLKSMRLIIISIKKALVNVSYIVLILLMFILIFELLGMSLLNGNVNYQSFMSAFYITFQILTMENWNSIMYDLMRLNKLSFFYLVAWIIFGNYIIFNLFTSILLQSFGNDEEDEDEQDEDEKIEKMFILPDYLYQIKKVEKEHKNKLKNKKKNDNNNNNNNNNYLEDNNNRSNNKNSMENNKSRLSQSIFSDENSVSNTFGYSDSNIIDESINKSKSSNNNNEDDESVEKIYTGIDKEIKYWQYVNKIFRKNECENALYFLPQTSNFRIFCMELISNKLFDRFILIMILCSTVRLILDTFIDGYISVLIFDISDAFFNIVFLLECVFKVLALGFVMDEGSYLRDNWNKIDLIIVCCSIFDFQNLFEKYFTSGYNSHSNLQFLKVLRLLRTLRPLRFISHNVQLKLIITSLFDSIIPICNALLIVLVVYFMFSIVGISLFYNLYHNCYVYSDQGFFTLADVDFRDYLTRYNINSNMIDISTFCADMYNGVMDTGPQFKFANIFNSIITAYVLSNTEGWPDIMNSYRVYSEYYGIFFIVYLLVVSYFFLNLFTGIMFKYFNDAWSREQKVAPEDKKAEKYYDFLTQIEFARPNYITFIKPKENSIRWYIREFADSSVLDNFIMIIIFLNMISMAMNYEGCDETYEYCLKIANFIFTGIFFAECILKFIAYGIRGYFYFGWNQFDFFVVIASLIDIVVANIDGIDATFLKSFQIIRVLRVLRVTRVLRLVKALKGLEKLIQTLSWSITALANVFILMFLLFCICAILGCYLYDGLKYSKFKDKMKYMNVYYNLDNFYKAFLLVFRCATGEDWPSIMNELAFINPDKFSEGQAYLYMIICNFISVVIMLNLFLMVTLQQYDEFTNKNYNPIEKFEAFCDEFRIAWNKYSSEKDEGFRIKRILLTNFFIDLNWNKINFPESNKLEAIKKFISDLQLRSDPEDCVYFHDVLFKIVYMQMGQKIQRDNPNNALIFKTEKQVSNVIKKMITDYIIKNKIVGEKQSAFQTFNPLTSHLYFKITYLYLKSFLGFYKDNREVMLHQEELVAGLREESVSSLVSMTSENDEKKKDNLIINEEDEKDFNSEISEQINIKKELNKNKNDVEIQLINMNQSIDSNNKENDDNNNNNNK